MPMDAVVYKPIYSPVATHTGAANRHLHSGSVVVDEDAYQNIHVFR